MSVTQHQWTGLYCNILYVPYCAVSSGACALSRGVDTDSFRYGSDMYVCWRWYAGTARRLALLCLSFAWYGRCRCWQTGRSIVYRATVRRYGWQMADGQRGRGVVRSFVLFLGLEVEVGWWSSFSRNEGEYWSRGRGRGSGSLRSEYGAARYSQVGRKVRCL